jgi:protein-L-isoaspartate(D-aspartate) O-methyltransferase
MPIRRVFQAAAVAVLLGGAAASDVAADRAAMVRDIERKIGRGEAGQLRRLDPRIGEVMRRTPRHLFVPESHRSAAYLDTPLPIGHEATISQPFMVAAMTQLADPSAGDVVLEVGTGSGYQAAVLSPLVRRVYTVEIVEPLARTAADRLRALGYANVEVRAGDGYAGWPEHAPFDAIIVTAGATHVPQPLVRQLKAGGRMIIPVGPHGDQELTIVEKTADGRVRERTVMAVRFVPLQERARRR